MNDAEYDEVTDKLTEIINYWIPMLGLQDWSISVKYYRGCIPGADSDTDAHCTPNWEYMLANICFDVQSIGEQEEWYLEEVVLHELFHCVTDEVVAETKGSPERVVTSLARIMRKAIKNPPTYFKKVRRAKTKAPTTEGPVLD